MANLNTKTIATGVLDILAVDGGIDASTARQVKDGDGTGSPIYITTTRVGIGDTTPDKQVHITAASGAANVAAAEIIKLVGAPSGSTGIANGIGFYTANASQDNALCFIGCNKTSDTGAHTGEMVFYTRSGTSDGAPGERMRIDSEGRVGIGDTNPSTKLHIKGAVTDQWTAILDNNTATDDQCWGLSLYFSGADPNDSTRQFLGCRDSAASRFDVFSNGQIKSVVHYTTSAGSTQTALYVDDSGYFGKVTSLREHKKNITDMEDISWLYNVRPVNFEYKVMETKEIKQPDGKIEECRTGNRLDEADGYKQYGMIAEELAEVSGAESLLEYDGDELSGISYHKFVPILVKAIQELSAKVEALENNNKGDSSEVQKQTENGSSPAGASSNEESSNGSSASGSSEESSSPASGNSDENNDASGSSSDSGASASGNEQSIPEGSPSGEWTKDQLKAYMDANSIVYNSGDTKNDLLSKIEGA